MWMTCLLVVAGPSLAMGAGTTANIEETFIERCWEYQHVINPGAFTDSLKNCTSLWEAFLDGFAHQAPCGVPISGYDRYRDEAKHKIIGNEPMFWEGVYPFANELADYGKTYWTIAGTLSGYILDGLLWCGQEDDPGINYSDCPSTSQCQGLGGGDSSEDALWKAISVTFSELAEGHVNVLLNGSNGAAFRNTSIFAQYELVNLTPEKGVTSLTLYVLHDIGKPKLESCGEHTLIQFEEVVKNQGLAFTCWNDPTRIRMYQCVDNTAAEECQLASNAITWSTSGPTWLIMSLLILVLARVISRVKCRAVCSLFSRVSI